MTATKNRVIWVFPTLFLTILFLLCRDAVAKGVQGGLTFCFLSVVPSVFPFSVCSACFSALPPSGKSSRSGGWFRRVFRLPTCGIAPVLVGIFCGFPLGARMVAEGYRAGIYAKDEAERLILISNQTSLPFLISAVGGAMRGSAKDGAILFAIQLTVAILTALLTGIGKAVPAPESRTCAAPPPFSPAGAVRSAVDSTLAVCGFITFFSVILSIANLYLPDSIYRIFSSVCEVGTACRVNSAGAGGWVLTAFAICFSGISVVMQTAQVTEGTDLSIRTYLVGKCLGGIGGAALGFLTLPLIG